MIPGSTLPTLTTERLALRWLDDGDLPSLFEIFSDPKVTPYVTIQPVHELAGAAKLLREIQQGFSSQTLFQWGVARREDDRVIGTCTLFALKAEHKRAEIGYALGSSHWGKGYITEALGALLRFAFGTLGLHRIEADVDPRNAASIRCLERLGFRREGYLRERYHVNGEIQDSVLFGLLRPEASAELSGEQPSRERPQPSARQDGGASAGS
jgi:RimJ/RimL family protein N-acetyltransferase